MWVLGINVGHQSGATLVKDGKNHCEIEESLAEIITSTNIFIVVQDLTYVVTCVFSQSLF